MFARDFVKEEMRVEVGDFSALGFQFLNEFDVGLESIDDVIPGGAFIGEIFEVHDMVSETI